MTALKGQIAIVTGAGTGIGAAIAERLSADGATLALVGRREAPLKELAAQLTNAHPFTADVTDELSVTSMVAAVTQELGAPSILVNNAGAAESAPFERTSLDLWNQMLAVNLTGAFLCARAVLPAMKKAGAGRIVTVASTAGLKGYDYVAAYCAAKHGAIGMTRALAGEVARKGVTVNAVCPGFTETPMLEESIANIVEKTGMDEAAARKTLTATNPQGRLVDPAEVADAVAWLCRKESGSITGQAIAVAGGEVMTG
ncbi:SDR family NAD(P)-dependent oxidoreductase [Hwanghaeella sp.]|uniref:SDR family NAD(P)-dependent oxidoreductase n=1 Tax=Hwanghaeella sp. TaxID=2605943 RepID=UPI003CCBF576